mmetsp:Transcript_9793/g.17300  ORF Transcript_9793/g.17300 Transcript_9793/m.17300 type:complete len:217 (+) Transcript_9793:701-1351(+)
MRYAQSSLLHHFHNLASLLGILRSKKSVRNTLLPGTPSTSNTMDVIFSIVGRVKVDHHLDALNIEPTGCNICRHHDGGPANLESMESSITLSLFTVSVNGHTRNAVPLLERTGQLITHPLGGSENEHTVLGTNLLEQLQQFILLLPGGIHDANLLINVGIGLKSILASDLHMCSVTEEILCQSSHLSGPRGSEHHGLALLWDILNDLADLGLKSHI